MERKKINLEEEFNRLVKKFGLDYRVIIIENKKDGRNGRVDTQNKIIYVNSKDPEEAYRILLHELIEIKIRPLINKYVRLINVLLDYIQNELYVEKERVIDSLLFLKMDD